MDDEIMVSICCLVYNHEKYLRQCLDGIVTQKCNFKFEAIVHDDASTDGSRAIIKEYAEKYPDIIKPIIQKENTFSKTHEFPIDNYVVPACKGKYLAFCEGDDFWTDSDKLQKQFDALENNPQCRMCVHRVNTVAENGDQLEQTYPSLEYGLKTGVIPSEKFMEVECDSYYSFQTSSYFCYLSDEVDFAKENPDFKRVALSGDTPILLKFSTLGDFYYFEEPMSCYRRGSVSSKERNKEYAGEQRGIERMTRQGDMMREFDKYTNGKYHELCERKANALLFYVAQNYGDWKMMCEPRFAYFLNKYTPKERLKIRLLARFPKIMNKYNKNKKS